MNEKKLYFGPLDSLRVYAFLIVFVSHAYFSFFTVTDERTRRLAHGEVGVHIFFVLSAFLITYLALQEYSKTNSFSITHFFKKRILRIWPLYFMVLVLSYVWHLLSAPEQSLGCASMFTYFLGNQCLLIGIPQSVGTSTMIPMWSISIEQQFYTVFPFVFVAAIWLAKRKAGSARILLGTFLASLLLLAFAVRYIHANDWEYVSYATVSSIPGFILGIFLAYILHARKDIIIHIRKNGILYGISALAAFLLTFKIKFMEELGVSLYILPAIYSAFIYIVLGTGQSVGDNAKEARKTALQYLGQISYGLYAYHMFAIVLMQHLDWPIGPLGESVLALAITVVLAHFSYRYIERWFLSFK